jgi:hypothetical protein
MTKAEVMKELQSLGSVWRQKSEAGGKKAAV